MAAHDSSVDSILKKGIYIVIRYLYWIFLDPCHDFAWCLDACVRDKHLDPQQMNKLKNILDNCKKSTVEVSLLLLCLQYIAQGYNGYVYDC